MPPTPNEPPRRIRSLAKILLGVSALGLLPLPLYWLVDYGVGEAIRSPVKKFVDQNFLLYAAIVVPSLFVFVVSAIYLLMQWASPPMKDAEQRNTVALPRRHMFRSAAWGVCWMLLVAVGTFFGGNIPFWCLLIQQGSIRETVLSAEIVLTVIAVGAVVSCPRQHRSWIVPLACGILVGEIILYVQFAMDGWKLDLAL